MSELIDNWSTYLGREEDQPYLRTKLLDVNLRLFQINESYRDIVLACCRHLTKAALNHYSDYTAPYGISGANCAIPFNIIAMVHNRGRPDAWAEVMINPTIEMMGSRITAKSNCGSIRLKKPIRVWRASEIIVSYWTQHGEFMKKTLNTATCALTVQHEVDHNQGILITDECRRVK